MNFTTGKTVTLPEDLAKNIGSENLQMAGALIQIAELTKGCDVVRAGEVNAIAQGALDRITSK